MAKPKVPNPELVPGHPLCRIGWHLNSHGCADCRRKLAMSFTATDEGFAPKRAVT
jgi:hypothetical protein